MMNSTLFKAILAMDSYNRGYDAGIKFGSLSGNNSDDSFGTKIGNASIITNSGIFIQSGNRLDDDIGFYGIAYQWNGEKVISYRGTDNVAVDSLTGFGVGSGVSKSPQAVMAFNFYNAVANGVDPKSSSLNISLTGHSLGGGLAGLVGAMYNKSGALFDNMAFENAAINVSVYTNPSDTALYSSALDQAVFRGATRWGPTITSAPSSKLQTYSLEGEFLSLPLQPGGRGLQTTPETKFSIGNNVELSGIDSGIFGNNLHSMASLIMTMWATEKDSNSNFLRPQDWVYSAQYFWPVMYDNAFAQDIRSDISLGQSIKGTSGYSDILRNVIAYSAIDEGDNDTKSRPFGDTAIRAFYDDANDLGKALSVGGGVSTKLIAYADDISEAFIQYAGQLALSKTLQSVSPDVLDGVLEFKTGASGSYLSVDLSATTWAVGTGSVIAQQYHLISEGIFGSLTYEPLLRQQMLSSWGDNTTNIFDRVLLSAEDAGNVDFSNISITDYSQASLIIGGNQSNTITGTNGKDLIIGSDQDDILYGNDGDDIFVAGYGNKTIYGGSGADTIFYDDAFLNGLTIINQTIQRIGGADTIFSIENFKLTNQDDTLQFDSQEASQSRILDGRGGTYTLTYADSVVSLYDEKRGMVYGVGRDIIKNIEKIELGNGYYGIRPDETKGRVQKSNEGFDYSHSLQHGNFLLKSNDIILGRANDNFYQIKSKVA